MRSEEALWPAGETWRRGGQPVECAPLRHFQWARPIPSVPSTMKVVNPAAASQVRPRHRSDYGASALSDHRFEDIGARTELILLEHHACTGLQVALETRIELPMKIPTHVLVSQLRIAAPRLEVGWIAHNEIPSLVRRNR